MLQYMIIMLDDTSTSFCYYKTNKSERRLIGLDDLKTGIRFAMIENLTIQFVYPDYELPQEYRDVIHTIDHSDIKPMAASSIDADVVTLDGWEWIDKNLDFNACILVLRTSLQNLLSHSQHVKELLAVVQRLNIVITDSEQFSTDQNAIYTEWLAEIGHEIENLYVNGKSLQFNLLTDRMMLTAMNNCGAGDTCITLAPNGKFYICPAFYYENPDDIVGSLADNINIRNKQLFKLDHAPICRECDSWHCKRCVWLNRKLTLEVNTPSYQQCVMAHLERNVSRDLLTSIRKHGNFVPENPEIPELDYIDPFEKIINN